MWQQFIGTVWYVKDICKLWLWYACKIIWIWLQIFEWNEKVTPIYWNDLHFDRSVEPFAQHMFFCDKMVEEMKKMGIQRQRAVPKLMVKFTEMSSKFPWVLCYSWTEQITNHRKSSSLWNFPIQIHNVFSAFTLKKLSQN